MKELKECPKCGLESPPETILCNCGFDYVLHNKAKKRLEKKVVFRKATFGAKIINCPKCDYEGWAKVRGQGYEICLMILISIQILFFAVFNISILFLLFANVFMWVFWFYLMPTRQICPICKYDPKGKKYYYGRLITLGLMPFLLIFSWGVIAFTIDTNAEKRHIKSNLKQIGLGLIMYANENDEKFPDKLSVLYPDYISEIKVFFNYRDNKDKIIKPENIDSLGWFEYLGTGLTQDADPNTVLARERYLYTNRWEKYCKRVGKYEVFVDGHVERTGEPFIKEPSR